MGRVGLAGRIDAPPNRMPQSISVTLPAEYGLGGLDELFGEPQDYGHKKRRVLVTPIDNAFMVEFPVVYHIVVWFIPPLGVVPKRPPPPFFVVQIPDEADEVYAIGLIGDRLEYKVFDKRTRTEKSPKHSDWIVEGQKYEPSEINEGDVWYLRIRFVRNAA